MVCADNDCSQEGISVIRELTHGQAYRTLMFLDEFAAINVAFGESTYARVFVVGRNISYQYALISHLYFSRCDCWWSDIRSCRMELGVLVSHAVQYHEDDRLMRLLSHRFCFACCAATIPATLVFTGDKPLLYRLVDWTNRSRR